MRRHFDHLGFPTPRTFHRPESIAMIGFAILPSGPRSIAARSSSARCVNPSAGAVSHHDVRGCFWGTRVRTLSVHFAAKLRAFIAARFAVLPFVVDNPVSEVSYDVGVEALVAAAAVAASRFAPIASRSS